MSVEQEGQLRQAMPSLALEGLQPHLHLGNKSLPWTALDLQRVHFLPHFNLSVTCLGALHFAHNKNIKNTIKISTLSSHANRQILGPYIDLSSEIFSL